MGSGPDPTSWEDLAWGASDELMTDKPDLSAQRRAGRIRSESGITDQAIITPGHGPAPIRVSPMAACSTDLDSRISSARRWRKEVTGTEAGGEIPTLHPAVGLARGMDQYVLPTFKRGEMHLGQSVAGSLKATRRNR
jgi:hypothetical protein